MKQHKPGQLRIIAGLWRGRKLDFPTVEGLRPTSDRVRETLFNWLQMDIAGARCLDLFAGSGALGLEALSRGASEVVMVEQDHQAAQQIRSHLSKLGSNKGAVEQIDVLHYLNRPSISFDIVFLDPPYALDCLADCCQLLEKNGWLSSTAIIYLEDSSQKPAPKLPTNWQLNRSKKAGEIGYHLALRVDKDEVVGS